tara:strand:+ start:736 stop:990 length:255 start_codon:yes stop_codon:yes gene_type:complete
MKKDWTKFRDAYRLENSFYNFVVRPGVFESSVAVFFIIGIPSIFIIGERFATILSVVFSVLTYLILKNEEKKFNKELDEYLKKD